MLENDLTKALELLQQGVDYYNTSKPEDELDVVGYVRDKFKSYGVDEERMLSFFDTHAQILAAKGKQAHAQMFHLNRYFSSQFQLADLDGSDTRIYRYQLLYEIDVVDWLKIFDQSILPALLESGSPRGSV